MNAPHFDGHLDALFDASIEAGHRAVGLGGLGIVADPPRSALARWLDSHSLVAALVGKRATGKTVAAQAVGREALNRENTVRYWHLDQFAAQAATGDVSVVVDAIDVDLLILDDVPDNRRADGWNVLARIIAARIRAVKKTLLVTYDRHIFQYVETVVAPPADVAFGNVEVIDMDPFGDARG